jgi:hypothetical protein
MPAFAGMTRLGGFGLNGETGWFDVWGV